MRVQLVTDFQLELQFFLQLQEISISKLPGLQSKSPYSGSSTW